MPLALMPPIAIGEPVPDPHARFELLGVLIHASICIDDHCAVESLMEYVLDARASLSCSTSIERDGLMITAGSDIRSGCKISAPRITIHRHLLSEIVAAGLPGRQVADVIDIGWLGHEGLRIRHVDIENGSSQMVRMHLETTSLTRDEAEAAIRSTSTLRKPDRRKAAIPGIRALGPEEIPIPTLD